MASQPQSTRQRFRFAHSASRVSVGDRAGTDHSPDAVQPGVVVAGSAASCHPQNDAKGGHPHHGRGHRLQFLYAAIDLLLVCFNGSIAYWLRFSSNSLGGVLELREFSASAKTVAAHYYAFLLLYTVLIILFCQSQDLYRTLRTRTAMGESLAVVKAVAFATILLSSFLYISGVTIVSRLIVGYCAVLNVVALIAWRRCKRGIVMRRLSEGVGVRNALIVGAGKVGQALAHQFEENKLLGYSFRGFLDANHVTDPRILGKVEELSRVARAEFVDDVFITIPSERELVKRIASEARLERLNVSVIPELYDGLGWDAPIHYVGVFPIMELHWKPMPADGVVMKRVLDALGSAVGLVVVSPILAVIAVVIRMDSRGPALYASPRVGRKGRTFVCYKFRTMVVDADSMKSELRGLNEREGPFFKISNDPRLTRLGKYLRKYSLDELPQLWNVLKGEMSLVGPRPHPLDDYAHYELDHLRRLDVKPGITGLWQITARRDSSFDTNMQLDLEYIENWGLRLDLQILLKTIREVLSGTGI